MAVLPAELKSPVGKIDPNFFPGELTAKLDERLTTYITEGVAEVDDALAGAELDAAVKHWAYYRAFEAVHLRLIATPAMIGIVGEGNTMFTGPQIDAFASQAAGHKSSFDAMLTVDGAIAQPIPSGGVATTYRW